MILFWWSGLMLGAVVVGGRDITFPRQTPPSMTLPPAGTPTPYQITFLAPTLTLGENGTIFFSAAGSGTSSPYTLSLLQLPNGDSNQAASSYKVLDLGEICFTDNNNLKGDCSPSSKYIFHTQQQDAIQKFPVYLDSKAGNNSTLSDALDNLFFCMGSPMTSPTPICNFYSDVFSLAVENQNISKAASSVSFQSTMTITASASATLLEIHGATSTADTDSITTTPATTSLFTTIITPTPSSTSSSSPSANAVTSHSNSGLSIGAKVGIALGALAFISLLLLLALFLLRKKHTSRKQKQGQAQPEQVMLTRDMHQDSFSQNLMMLEKDRNASTIAGIDTPSLAESPSPQRERESTIPLQRHLIYNPVSPVAAGTGTGANIPKRKPTNSTILTSAPASPTSANIPSRSGTTGSSEARTPPDAFETYHDVPIYGDARHVPQVFNTAPERGVVGHGSASPFLSEEGMSPEEMARLEEEEARIDAAIAAAERDRGVH